jgi:vancomycin resistance protein VanJ
MCLTASAAQRYDYIWHTAELQALDASVGSDGGSDHLPVVARLAWR